MTPEDRQQHAENMSAYVGRVLRAVAGFEKARAGRRPYEAQAHCPSCRATGTTLQYRWSGTRASRMWCDTPGCGMRMMS